MSMRHAVDRAERLRDALATLSCSRAEALALAVLLCGACGLLVLLWVLARPAEPLAGSGRPPWQADGATATLEAEDAHAHDGHLPSDPGRAASPSAASAGGAAGISSAASSDQVSGAAGEVGGAAGERFVPARLVVHVSGLVAAPGVYDLPEHSRVADAIHAAGGLLPAARPDGLNLARALTDGEQLHVPGAHELGPAGSGVASSAGGHGGADSPAGAGGRGDAWLPDGRLDINRATQADFEELPGIGPVLAERLVTHREETGGFASIGDLLAVRGIGEKTLAALADLIAA